MIRLNVHPDTRFSFIWRLWKLFSFQNSIVTKGFFLAKISPQHLTGESHIQKKKEKIQTYLNFQVNCPHPLQKKWKKVEGGGGSIKG